MAEVLARAGDFDIIHYHLSTAWLPLAATTRTPGLFTIHTCPHVDDEFVFDEEGKSTLRFRPRSDGGLSGTWTSPDGKTSMEAGLRPLDLQRFLHHAALQ